MRPIPANSHSNLKNLSQLADLSDRCALVTGAAGGVGEAICQALAESGCHVVLTDRDQSSLQQRVDEITAHGGKASWVVTDLLDWEPATSSLRKEIDRIGRLDILINNAAFVGTSGLSGWAVPYGRQDADLWQRVLELNLTVPFRLAQLFRGQLAANHCGSIVNISSIYGMLGPDQRLYEGTTMGNPAAYAASKGGLIQLTRWLATSLPPGVRANAIALGGIERGQPETFQSAYVSRTPLGRMGCEEDVKGAIAYLSSDLSRYVTGQLLPIDGGWSAW